MTNQYFGPDKFRKEWETQIHTPVGEPCSWCDEPIAEGDIGTMQPFVNELRPIHYECQLRGVIGSVGHLRKRCSCYGGTEEDPEGMTKREAAIAAADLWHRSNERKLFP